MCFFFRSVAAGHNIPAAVKHEKTHQRAILLELDTSTVEMGWNIRPKFHEFSQKKNLLKLSWDGFMINRVKARCILLFYSTVATNMPCFQFHFPFQHDSDI